MPHLENKDDLKVASRATIASLLNLTFLPVIGFIWLLIIMKKSASDSLAHYYARFGIKLNLVAALLLGVVSLLMIYLGGFHSPWTWVYVIGYFTLVHSLFIVAAVWAMIRSWSGQQLRPKVNH
ncbi:MAG TPA: hypothetical protein ENJ60_04130 [Aeromonadales bacterium]|nr:hypothetical protein [Aeromonadales bacterium]